MDKKVLFPIFVVLMVCCSFFSSCSNKFLTPDTIKYLPAYYEYERKASYDIIKENALELYVDYSTCIYEGQNSKFYNELLPSFVNATKTFYSIKGDEIQQESGSVFTLLRSIENVNYADLQTAIEKMAESEKESALLTDGEFYQASKAASNVNNPYMANAFKKWLKRGHDIYILSEPYIENKNGSLYNKKRFYILFTDSRLRGNIYNRIMQTAKMVNYPEVEIFHLSADHPSMYTIGSQHFTVNTLMTAKVEGKGDYEIQEWPLSWKNGIEPLFVQAVDETTGEPLPNGAQIASGIKIDRNGLGAFRIKKVYARVTCINERYSSFVEQKEAGIKKVDLSPIQPQLVQNLIKIDDKEFEKHGMVALYFDTNMYDPSCLTGSPYNYLKIEICVSEVEPIFSHYEDMFKFDSIDLPGQQNVSIAASIKQCMTDDEVKTKVMQSPIYTIYIQSSER